MSGAGASALALLNEGLRRVRALGGTVAYVGTGSDSPANRLYEAAGFALINVMHRWTKALEEVDSSACR